MSFKNGPDKPSIVFTHHFEIFNSRNKKFLETDYPRGSPDSYRDIEVFRRPNDCRDHFGPPRIVKRQFRPSQRGSIIGNPDAERRGII